MSLLDYFDSRDKKERMSYVLNLFLCAVLRFHNLRKKSVLPPRAFFFGWLPQVYTILLFPSP